MKLRAQLLSIKPFCLSLKRNMSQEVVRSTAASGSRVYESQRAVFEYLLFHYGDHNDQMPFADGPKSSLDFTERCATLCSSISGNKNRALDVGCSVGGSAFHLSKHFDEVVGVDFSEQFVAAANKLKTDGQMGYEILEQGSTFKKCTATLPSDIHKSRVQFQQGDACNLSQSLGTFDVILASNLLCRLPNPRKFLRSVPKFLNKDGHLVLISPYSWLEEYTPKSEWIGGTTGEKESAELVADIMANELKMTLVHQEDVPFLIREHKRKYQYGVSACTIWKKVL